MIDLRPVGYVIGLLVLALGAFMIAPALLDFIYGRDDWRAFVIAAMITLLVGGALTLGCFSGRRGDLSIEQTFLLVVFAWIALPVFGAGPFILGETSANWLDALFESVSGITTTGATIFPDLDGMAPGLLLWRALLQWIGGIGIVVFAMAFLPTLQVGGMQIFRTEGFDTFGKILPRARDLAEQVFSLYLSLTLLCALAYGASGMNAFDAVCHAMTTIATGGFGNYNDSFGANTPITVAAQYYAILFMLLASLPFVRFVQLAGGEVRPLWRDSQVRAFMLIVVVSVACLFFSRLGSADAPVEQLFRETTFNAVSLITGTGYNNANYTLWGAFAISLLFMLGLIGGCAGSTSCSVKVFRYQVLAAVVATELRRVRRPSGVFAIRYDRRRLDPATVTSVLTFFFIFIATLGALTLALAWSGLDTVTALSGAAAALANIGPGFGETIGPKGYYGGLNDTAKGLLIFGMLLGRLELLTVLVLFTASFWRR